MTHLSKSHHATITGSISSGSGAHGLRFYSCVSPRTHYSCFLDGSLIPIYYMQTSNVHMHLLRKFCKIISTATNEDINVFSQFYQAKVNTQVPLLVQKMLLYSYEEDMKQISEGNTSPINLRKVAPLLKFQSMSIQMPFIATDNRKQFQSQNWTIMFGIQLMWKTFKLFKETAKSITKPH